MNYHNPADVAKQIAELKNIELQKCSLDDVKSVLSGFLIPHHTFPQIAGEYVFRGQVNDSDSPFDSISRISYNPNPSDYTQRASLPGENVFYASNGIGTVAYEAIQDELRKGIKPFYYLTVGKWQIKSPLEIMLICHSKQALMVETGLEEACSSLERNMREKKGYNDSQILKLFRKSKDSQESAKFELQHSFFRILMEVLSKDMIRQWILPSLAFSAHGRPSVVDPVELVEVILYKLKSGCQWRLLPVKPFFTGASLTWQGVYARFNAWRKDGSWQVVWRNLLRQNGAHLDCSSVQFDGSHTPAKNGGAAVGYQARKKARTTTTLFLSDNRGQPLACASPQAGNHHDTHLLNTLFREICASLEAANIPVAGLFLNADKAFDTTAFRAECARRDIEANIPRNRRATDWQTDDDTPFDPELYRRRVVVEHTNAWLDGFKTLLVRYETSVGNWLAWHWLAFVVIFLRKINQKPTF